MYVVTYFFHSCWPQNGPQNIKMYEISSFKTLKHLINKLNGEKHLNTHNYTTQTTLSALERVVA